MINEVIKLKKDDDNITLTTYCGNTGYKRDALLIIPGGGYGCICDDREGEPIAFAFLKNGVNCFVLKYSVGDKAKFPTPLVEASLAIKYIKDNADKYCVNKERVFAVGFSAGGHLAASLGTLWHTDEVNKEIPDMKFGYNKPKGVILCYPVITSIAMGHKDSFYNILGTKTPTDEELEKYSLHNRIDKNSSPAFIMHTANDSTVPVENSLYAAEAYSKAKIPFEMHIYPDSPHGVALGNKITAGDNEKYDNPQIARWVDDAFYWMNCVR